ncbi:MAG: lytic transglycosylase domain-containing protein [Verrucomicrobiota bacterium]|nr:lytic transglycosylase domain-containing protein [Verrucomicrobiota bacterium]
MRRFLAKVVILLLLATVAGGALFLWRSPDPMYAAQARLNGFRFSAYDSLILETARRHGVDPMLVKAIVWRESGFHPDKTGTSGERGLMQVTKAAAADWVRAEKIETFVPTDLFDPHTNLEVGVWYLRQALDRWKDRDDPTRFALAEYNAGRSRVDRWLAATGRGDQATSEHLVQSIDFPSTRKYIEDITRRHRFYHKRGRL